VKHFDVIVIGGGPGGYVAAVRASQLGLSTALVEKESLGGTCLNWGCIPTKSLLRNAEVIELLSKGRTFGFSMENLVVDYGAAHKRSRSVVKRQVKRVEHLLKTNNVEMFSGSGKFKTSHEIIIDETGETISGGSIIVATGAKSRQLPGIPFDGARVINFKHALTLQNLPKSAVIVGSGPIGMEFATIWNRYGVKVTVVELEPHVLPQEDTEVAIEAEKQFHRQGITIRTGSLVKAVTSGDEGAKVSVDTSGHLEEITAETVLIAIGFSPNCDELNLAAAGVEVGRGGITVDETMRTSVSNIFAIGDVTGKLGLAHVASAQAMIAVETIGGKRITPLVYHNIPRCTYSSPETASVGLTELQAREKGYDVSTALCPFVANGKAIAMEENSGFVKIVADAVSKKILGVHFVGGHVTELVSGLAGMITLEGGIEALGSTVHPHPTLSEAIMEAAHKLCGHAIHI
jgi:dihydrolipoamide dehydrogenase